MLRANCIFIFLLVFTAAFSQAASNYLDRNYQFRDGLYLSLESFQTDTPDWPIDQLEGRLVTNDETGLTKTDYLAVKTDTGSLAIPLRGIWGICLDGLPYIRIKEEDPDTDFVTFALLRVRGAICYFTFESEKDHYVEVKAYNPLNGKPFRRGRVKNKVVVNNKRMLRFETGEVLPFNQNNLLVWVKDDARLVEAIEGLPEEGKEEKLYRSLLVYDDRHPVLINRKD